MLYTTEIRFRLGILVCPLQAHGLLPRYFASCASAEKEATLMCVNPQAEQLGRLLRRAWSAVLHAFYFAIALSFWY